MFVGQRRESMEVGGFGAEAGGSGGRGGSVDGAINN